jgi:rhodanese-related sulfurtransferase
MASKRLIPLLSQPLRSSFLSNSSSRILAPATAVSRKHPSHPHTRFFSSTPTPFKQDPPSTSLPSTSSTSSKIYTYPEILSLTANPPPNTILIDVREPSELRSTGTIPTSKNIPITTSPDAFFLSESEFEDRFGFPRPGAEDEVVFFCKAGVRSKAAAQVARNAGFGGKVGEYPGSWMEWEGKGGEAEKVG